MRSMSCVPAGKALSFLILPLTYSVTFRLISFSLEAGSSVSLAVKWALRTGS